MIKKKKGKITNEVNFDESKKKEKKKKEKNIFPRKSEAHTIAQINSKPPIPSEQRWNEAANTNTNAAVYSLLHSSVTH